MATGPQGRARNDPMVYVLPSSAIVVGVHSKARKGYDPDDEG